MAGEEPRIKTSKSGRVPQWVMDEALGKKVEPVPFRAAPSTSTKARVRSRRRGGLKLVLIIAGVAAIAVGLNQAGILTSPTAPGTTNRIVAGHDSPPAGVGERHDRLLPAPLAPTEAAGARYRFLQHQRGTSAPVTWDPCRPIRYAVRPDNAPPGGDVLLNAAFAAVSEATGLQFVNAGTTNEAPADDRDLYQPEKYGNRWAPVLVAWATDTEVPDFGVDFAGEAGPAAVGTVSGDATYVSGTVMLSAKDFQRFAATGQTAVAQSVVLHELGHLLGLAHVPDSTQVMFPRANPVMAYGNGDLQGLAAVGRGRCQPDV